mgnify:CR=1 FL=1
MARTKTGRLYWTEQEKVVKDSLDHAIAQINRAKGLWKMGMVSANFGSVLTDAQEAIDRFRREARIYDQEESLRVTTGKE